MQKLVQVAGYSAVKPIFLCHHLLKWSVKDYETDSSFDLRHQNIIILVNHKMIYCRHFDVAKLCFKLQGNASLQVHDFAGGHAPGPPLLGKPLWALHLLPGCHTLNPGCLKTYWNPQYFHLNFLTDFPQKIISFCAGLESFPKINYLITCST